MFLKSDILYFALIGMLSCQTSSSDSTKAPDGSEGSSYLDASSSQQDVGDRQHDSGISIVDASTLANIMFEEVSIVTSDSLMLHGVITRFEDRVTKKPAVLLLHQFRQDHTQWTNFQTRLSEAGYVVLSIDLRGHGKSDSYQGNYLSGILNDPNGAPNDVRAALQFLREQTYVDTTRLGVVGTSIGANLAVASAILKLSKTSVAISPRLPPIENLAGTPTNNMKSVFYLAGENDSGGQAQDCQTMFSRTEEPKSIHIYPNTADHGLALFQSQPDLQDKIIMWMSQNL